ncbi:MAG: 23S rRNA (uracil1939-C5)-methyltransferase [Myxococcota bacterium]|jgi:23S rRNA (uracil1939-C5)-methyltransferase
MSRRKKIRKPVELTVDQLELKGSSGLDADGHRWIVRGAAVGETVQAWPGGRKKGKARIFASISPAPDAVTPECPAFGLCGGCQFQHMPVAAQRHHKSALVSRSVGDLTGVTVHPSRSADAGYHYRNKIELSFGPYQFVSEAQKDDLEFKKPGSFLGFHPPGWFSRIVPLSACYLAEPEMNAVLSVIRDNMPSPPWNTQDHTGIWRHVVIRKGEGVLVTLVTTSGAPPEEVRGLGAKISALPFVVGVLWVVTDRLSDVAEGELAEVLHGQPWLDIKLADITFRIPYDGFFQVNTAGAQVLFDTIAQALAPTGGGTLLDLYCGVGAIGMFLADRFDRVIGAELNPASIACAKENATRNNITGEWHAGKVEEILPSLQVEGPRWIVVDPPRVGLHPSAARFLADQEAEALVYVACNPGSLGRDRVILEAGGWRLEALWSVDLFAQTPHTEAVARFVR